jgi:hypothetical protein
LQQYLLKVLLDHFRSISHQFHPPIPELIDFDFL